MFQKLVRTTVLCSILAVGVNVHAQFTYNWNNAGGGSYHTAGNWSAGGGRLEFTGKLTNAPGSFISGNGTLATSSGTPGSLGLNNRGSIVFTSGANHVFGDVMNEGGGVMVTTGGATTTFHDDMLHNGTEIRTSGDSRSVFPGSVAGAGSFTGTGGVYFEGDLRPGKQSGVRRF